uniref:Uncharacterized protein n=1 Tax=Leptobrachium leishanense TaxID=445787 RepID=A0A8C5RAP7_9ANUR
MQVLRHSPDTLRRALLSRNGSLFPPITICQNLTGSRPHRAHGDLQEFYCRPNRRVPTPRRKTIYIHTIGSNEKRIILYIQWLSGYCQAFFHGLPAKIQGPTPLAQTGCAFRVNDNSENLQVHVGMIAARTLTDDALCIMGVTMIDLYPEDSWNFVFGSASLTEGTRGNIQFARDDDSFYGFGYKGKLKQKVEVESQDYSVFDGYYTPPIISPLLMRSCKVGLSYLYQVTLSACAGDPCQFVGLCWGPLIVCLPLGAYPIALTPLGGHPIALTPLGGHPIALTPLGGHPVALQFIHKAAKLRAKFLKPF